MSSLTQVNVGQTPNDNQGDPLRDAFEIVNNNNLIVNGVQGFSPLPLYQSVTQALGFGYNYFTLHTLDSNANINFSSVLMTFKDEAAEQINIQVSLWTIVPQQGTVQPLDVPGGIDFSGEFKYLGAFYRDIINNPAQPGIVALNSFENAVISIPKGTNLLVVVGAEGCQIAGGFTPVTILAKQNIFTTIDSNTDIAEEIKNGQLNETGVPAVEFFYKEIVDA